MNGATMREQEACAKSHLITVDVACGSRGCLIDQAGAVEK